MSVLGAVLIAPVLPQMTEAFADTPGVDVLVPIVLTVPALFIGLAAPFAGIIVDRVDRKRLLLIAMVAYSIFGTAPLYLNSLGAIVGSRVLVGICEAAIMTCCTTLIGDYWSGPKRSKYLGLQTLVAALAATVFLALGGVLGANGWRTPFWMYVIALLLVVPMAKLLWQPARPSDYVKGTPMVPVPWRKLLGPCLVTLFGGIVFYALIVELSFVLTDVGITSTATIGGISAAMSLATAAGAIVFGKLSRLSPRIFLPIEFLLAAAGLIIVFATTSVAGHHHRRRHHRVRHRHAAAHPADLGRQPAHLPAARPRRRHLDRHPVHRRIPLPADHRRAGRQDQRTAGRSRRPGCGRSDHGRCYLLRPAPQH